MPNLDIIAIIHHYSLKNMILFPVLFGLIFTLSAFTVQDAFAELDLADKKLTGNSNNSEFELVFSDKTASGHITFENHLITFENAKVIVKNDSFHIIDKHSGVKILGKQVDAEKYQITFKIKINDSQTKLQFIAKLYPIENAIKNTSQRDFVQEIQNKLDTEKKSKSMTAKELQLMEKQKKLDESLKKSDKKIQKIVEEKQKTDGEKTAKNITDKYNEFKNSGKGTSPIIKNKEEKPKEPVIETILSGSKVNVLVSQYERVTKGTSYVFQVKTFDVKKYSGTDWNKFDGKLDGVNISAQIIAPDGQVKKKFSGLTKYGIFEGSILVKESPWPQGKYTLIVNSEFQGDKTSKSLKFFVVEEGGKTTTNRPPVSNAGIDQTVNEHNGAPTPVFTVVTLNGSGSSDPDGDVITYSWTQISGTSVTLSNISTVSPTFTSPNVTFPGLVTLVFKLTVSDGSLTSTDEVTITINAVN